MMVYTKTPRVRTFRAFASTKQAASFVRGLGERFLSVRHNSGYILVNYYAR
jgi:hypothetical protein